MSPQLKRNLCHSFEDRYTTQIIKWLMCRTYAEVVQRDVYADLREMYRTGAISI